MTKKILIGLMEGIFKATQPYRSAGSAPIVSALLWNGGIFIVVILLGIWIGRSTSSESLLSPPVLLIVALCAGSIGLYLAKGFTGTITAFDYPIPLKLLIPLTVLYLGIQASFQELERDLLWGEIFVLLLLPAIGRVRYRHPGQRRIILMAYFMLFVLPVYGSLYTWLYWGDDYQTYFFLRHLAVFHYIIFFFAAYNHAGKFIELFDRFYWAPLLFIIPGLLRIPVLSYPFSQFSLIGGPVLLAWCYTGYLHGCKSRRAALVGFLVYLVLLSLLGLRATDIVIIGLLSLLLPGMGFLKHWHRWVPLPARRLAFSVTLFFLLFAGGFSLYTVGREIQENIIFKLNLRDIPEQAAGLELGNLADNRYYGSTMWRVALWAQFFSRFLENPFGIGLGTRGFEEELGTVLAGVVPDESWGKTAEYQTYMVGAHNSFITFLARFGIVFLIPLGACFIAVARMISGYCRLCGYSPFSTRESRVVFGSIIAFLVVVLEASFNMVIETPLYAALFWFSFGFMTRLLGDYLVVENREPAAVMT